MLVHLVIAPLPAVPLWVVQGGLGVLVGDARSSCGFSCCSVSLLLCCSLLEYLRQQKFIKSRLSKTLMEAHTICHRCLHHLPFLS